MRDMQGRLCLGRSWGRACVVQAARLSSKAEGRLAAVKVGERRRSLEILVGFWMKGH